MTKFKFISFSEKSRYFLTINYIFFIVYKILLSAQYLSSVENHSSILFFFPFSIILSSFDFIILYTFFKIMDSFNKFKILIYFYFVISVCGLFFLLYDFSIYQYFRGFTNYGLSEFLAYDSKELASYFIFSLNPFLISTITVSFFLIFVIFCYTFKNKKILFMPISESVLLKMFLFNLIFSVLLFFIPFNYKVRIDKNPFFEYAKTTLLKSIYLSEGNKDLKNLPNISSKNEYMSPDNNIDYEKTKGKNVILVVMESIALERTPLGNDNTSQLFFIKDLAEKSFNFTSFRTFFPATTRSLLGFFCSNYPGTDYRSITNIDSNFNCDSIIDSFKFNGFDTSYFSPVLLDFDRFGESKIVKKFDYVFEPSEIIKNGSSKRKYGTKTAIEEEIVQEEIFKRIANMKKKEKPFFIFYFPYWTHAPYEHPFKSSRGLNTINRYYQAQEYMNESMIKFLQKLDNEKILDDSIVIFTSDHGESFGRKTGNYIHPNYLYDENLKVPFLIYIKGITDKSPETFNNPATVFDFAPTISDLSGLKRFNSWIGNNMFERKTKPIFIYTRAMELHSGILDGNYKYFFNHVAGERYFFDLKNDPMEENNLSESLENGFIEKLDFLLK